MNNKTSTPRVTWTTFSSANDNLPMNFVSQAFALGDMIGRHRHNYCFGGYLGGLMGQVYKGIDAARQKQDCPAEEKSHVISVPYHHYYVANTDHYFQQVHVKQTLKEQQTHFCETASLFVALPGGIGTRGEIWNTLEELRCNKDFCDKHLFIVNVDNCYESFINDIDMMLKNGTALQSDFARMSVVENVDALEKSFGEKLNLVS